MFDVRSFAVSNGRNIKAEKIEAVLCAALGVKLLSGLSILDVGAGSGHIAAHFISGNTVTIADVENQVCVVEPSLKFALIKGRTLPFDDASFDVVILNHVLTYIPDQVAELMEIRRILHPSGVCYIALPNRLFPRDPHSGLPFVHYLPRVFYQKILSWLTGANEDVRMHTPKGMTELFRNAGLGWKEYTAEILHDPVRFHSGLSLRLPAWRWLSIVSPTNVYVLSAETQE